MVPAVLGSRPARPRRILAALALILAVTIVFLYAIFLAQAEYRLIRQLRLMDLHQGADALLSEIDDDAALRKLFPQLERLKSTLIPLLKSRRINVFARPQAFALGEQVPEARIAAAGACRGAIEQVVAVDGVPAAFRLEGWAWDDTARRPPERIVVLGADRRVTGYGSSGAPRLGVAAANPGVDGGLAGWTGYGRAAAGQSLGAYGLTGAGALCAVATRTAPAP